MKILHLAVDDKFTPFAQDVFESAFPGNNQFRVMRLSGGAPRFVRSAENVRFVARRYWFSSSLRSDMQWADCLVIHFMNHWFSRAIDYAPAGLPIVWHGWGADYYDLLDGYDRLHLPLTKTLVSEIDKNRANAKRIRDSALRIATFLLNRVLFRDWRRHLLERVDVISMLPDEFELLRRSHPQVRAIFHQLYCSSAEDSFSQGADMDGPDILLGNSATATNNHLDAIESLCRLDLGERKIVVPLNYGDREYADAICAHGRRRFGGRFVPLLQYLSPAEFGERISSCGFVFMNHIRQQATGTVSLAMFRGAKVFLRPENLLLSFYQSQGTHIFRFPDTSTANSDLSENVFAPLQRSLQKENRDAIARYWSREKIVASAAALRDVVA